MATEGHNGVASDAEASEKPVREQLKKASISKASGDGVAPDGELAQMSDHPDENGENGEGDESRGRIQKKRSFEESESGDVQDPAMPPPSRHHTRKRSRDSTVEEVELNSEHQKSFERSTDVVDFETDVSSNGHPTAPANDRPRTPEQTVGKRSEAAVEGMTSPKIKRSRLEENGAHSAETALTDATAPLEKVEDTTESTTEAKPPAAVPSTSGFAKASTISPFASLSGSKSPSLERATSPSAFAASGFSSLTGSGSGFGAIGKSAGGFGTGGGFATGGKSPIFGGDTITTTRDAESLRPSSGSPFGGVLGQQSGFSATATAGTSAFGSGASGFGKLGGSSGFGGSLASGGFGSLGGSGGLSSFASGKPLSTLPSSSKPAKAFGAPADDDGDEEAAENGDEADDAGLKSPLSQESDKQDERFYEQELETGEEDEFTEYSCRAKLYNFASVAEGKKEWKERGLGVVRLNVTKPAPGEDTTKPKARLLMRAEGSHRVILNTPVKKEIKFGAPTGGPPQNGFVYFMGAMDGKASLELLQLKIRQQFATELHEKIVELQEAM